MTKWFFISIVTILLSSCTRNNRVNNLEKPEDIRAKELLQGIWIDNNNEIPLMNIKGDTIYHNDPQNIPAYFKIVKDSLYILGHTISSYHIDRQSEHTFWFHSISGDVVKLHKSENPGDSIIFSDNQQVAIPIYSEVTQRDSIVYYNNIRYRAYVYINPSKIKVTKTVCSDEGLRVDNVYYDNIIHICVYKGNEKIYAKDINKQMFDKVVSADFLSNTILTDINFINVNASGFLYQANICIPESYVSQLVNLIVSFDGQLKITAPGEGLLTYIE